MFRLPLSNHTKQPTGPYNPDSGKFSEVSEISRLFQPFRAFYSRFPGNILPGCLSFNVIGAD